MAAQLWVAARLSRRLVEAQEAERARIAAELHDQIGRTLTGLTLLLEGHQGLSAEVFQARLDLARKEARALLETIREMTPNLRPPLLDDLALPEPSAGKMGTVPLFAGADNCRLHPGGLPALRGGAPGPPGRSHHLRLR
jgi:two-component system sensor histidine kinase UhpB